MIILAAPPDRAGFGWATAPEPAYVVTPQLSLNVANIGSVTQDDLYVLWPDGRIAHLYVYRRAPNHDHGPAWHLIVP